jgi:sarcosine oxidase subunit beta
MISAHGLDHRAGSIPRIAEVVIIGGGVNGLSAAFQLAKRGVRDVVVLERRTLGSGATGKSGALVRCHYANVPEALLTLYSLGVFTNWRDEVGVGEPGFEAVGFLQVVAPEHSDNLRANVAAHRAAGIDSRVVDRQQLADIEPLLRTDDLEVAAFEPGSGYADPNATLYGFAAAAERLGVRIVEHTAATSIEVAGGHVVGVRTTAGAVATDRVLLAGGSWANGLLLPLGIDLGMEPVRTQVVVFRWPRSMDQFGTHRVVIDAVNHSWIRPVPGYGTLIGAERSVGGVDPDALDEGTRPESVGIARDVLAARFPIFGDAVMRGGWAGTYMRSADGHPIIDRAPGIDGMWLMAGDSGSSFKTAPAIGICLAEWMTDGVSRLVDLSPFRATRFAEGRPWLDRFAYGDDRQLTVSR